VSADLRHPAPAEAAKTGA